MLDESEINDLQAETLTVLLGLTDMYFYAIDIENEIGVSKDDANKIAEEALEKIFTPIGNMIIENIKKSGKHKDANAEQNLDFILSGGDYLAFAAPNSPLEEYSAPKAEGGGSVSPLLNKERGWGEVNYPPRPLTTKSTPQEGNIPTTPRKLDDLRSKFTI